MELSALGVEVFIIIRAVIPLSFAHLTLVIEMEQRTVRGPHYWSAASYHRVILGHAEIWGHAGSRG